MRFLSTFCFFLPADVTYFKVVPGGFYVLLTVPPCIILQISPTMCTILLNIFISLLYMFRAPMCPSSGENYCMYATLVFVILYGWCLVCRPDANHTE